MADEKIDVRDRLERLAESRARVAEDVAASLAQLPDDSVMDAVLAAQVRDPDE